MITLFLIDQWEKVSCNLYLEKCIVFVSSYNTLLGEIYQEWNQLQRLDILLNLSCNLSTQKIANLNNIKSKLRTLAKDNYTFDEYTCISLVIMSRFYPARKKYKCII